MPKSTVTPALMSCPAVGIYATLQGFSEVPVAAARACLTREPIVTDMYVWDDFFDYTTHRASSYSPNMVLGEPRLHSVCVVGYTADAWTIKNSFGSGWGDGTGFGRIKMGTYGLLTDNPPAGLGTASGIYGTSLIDQPGLLPYRRGDTPFAELELGRQRRLFSS